MSAEQVYLGADLGAESGRVMAGLWDGRRMRIEELHRFPNGGVEIGGTLRWDILRLWSEIQNGLALGARRFGKAIVSVGVDTWGVDFVLMSKSNELLGMPFTYRDARTRGLMARAFERVPRAEIFAATGIQFLEINSLFQLLALQQQSPEILAAADCFLTIPDFLNWCLSGERACEFTNATTTQCFHPTQRTWSTDMLKKFGLPTAMFPKVIAPGTRLGSLRESVVAKTGLARVDLIAPATHDTGSAVVAVPTASKTQGNFAYISSGTWSLMGTELSAPVLTDAALARNFTNEGGVDFTFRLLKNIMGLWLVQQCRRAFEAKHRSFDYAELVRLAGEAAPLRSFVEPDDARFLNPPDMPAAIQDFCRETNQPVPQSEGEIVRCALEGLALKYAATLDGIEALTGKRAEVIHIVGGGSRNDLLNQLAANACDRPVLAGPVEATVLGNLLVQAKACGELTDLAEIRSVVRGSGEVREFLPDPGSRAAWTEARGKFAALAQT
ncbi:MAG: rhamnulokinase [Verrucomicrobia bacterium]|nr:rhamnulokinase [Verrucomicrobiota bacterium]